MVRESGGACAAVIAALEALSQPDGTRVGREELRDQVIQPAAHV